MDQPAADHPNAYGVLPRSRNTYPRTRADFAVLETAIREFVVDPDAPRFLRPDSLLFTQGSCFAENIHNALVGMGYRSVYNNLTEALNSPLANCKYFEQVIAAASHPARAHLAAAHVFILTLGLAPCWFRRDNRAFVLEPDPRRMNEYFQRTLSVDECKGAIEATLASIRALNPDLWIVLTLSPVPLARTFELSSALVADAVSKCTLRAAIHESLQSGMERVVYFPSFEIVRWLGAHCGEPFGADDGLSRHVSLAYVQAAVSAFIQIHSAAAPE